MAKKRIKLIGRVHESTSVEYGPASGAFEAVEAKTRQDFEQIIARRPEFTGKYALRVTAHLLDNNRVEISISLKRRGRGFRWQDSGVVRDWVAMRKAAYHGFTPESPVGVQYPSLDLAGSRGIASIYASAFFVAVMSSLKQGEIEVRLSYAGPDVASAPYLAAVDVDVYERGSARRNASSIIGRKFREQNIRGPLSSTLYFQATGDEGVRPGESPAGVQEERGQRGTRFTLIPNTLKVTADEHTDDKDKSVYTGIAHVDFHWETQAMGMTLPKYGLYGLITISGRNVKYEAGVEREFRTQNLHLLTPRDRREQQSIGHVLDEFAFPEWFIDNILYGVPEKKSLFLAHPPHHFKKMSDPGREAILKQIARKWMESLLEAFSRHWLIPMPTPLSQRMGRGDVEDHLKVKAGNLSNYIVLSKTPPSSGFEMSVAESAANSIGGVLSKAMKPVYGPIVPGHEGKRRKVRSKPAEHPGERQARTHDAEKAARKRVRAETDLAARARPQDIFSEGAERGRSGPTSSVARGGGPYAIIQQNFVQTANPLIYDFEVQSTVVSPSREEPLRLMRDIRHYAGIAVRGTGNQTLFLSPIIAGGFRRSMFGAPFVMAGLDLAAQVTLVDKIAKAVFWTLKHLISAGYIRLSWVGRPGFGSDLVPPSHADDLEVAFANRWDSHYVNNAWGGVPPWVPEAEATEEEATEARWRDAQKAARKRSRASRAPSKESSKTAAAKFPNIVWSEQPFVTSSTPTAEDFAEGVHVPIEGVVRDTFTTSRTATSQAIPFELYVRLSQESLGGALVPFGFVRRSGDQREREIPQVWFTIIVRGLMSGGLDDSLNFVVSHRTPRHRFRLPPHVVTVARGLTEPTGATPVARQALLETLRRLTRLLFVALKSGISSGDIEIREPQGKFRIQSAPESLKILGEMAPGMLMDKLGVKSLFSQRSLPGYAHRTSAMPVWGMRLEEGRKTDPRAAQMPRARPEEGPRVKPKPKVKKRPAAPRIRGPRELRSEFRQRALLAAPVYKESKDFKIFTSSRRGSKKFTVKAIVRGPFGSSDQYITYLQNVGGGDSIVQPMYYSSSAPRARWWMCVLMGKTKSISLRGDPIGSGSAWLQPSDDSLKGDTLLALEPTTRSPIKEFTDTVPKDPGTDILRKNVSPKTVRYVYIATMLNPVTKRPYMVFYDMETRRINLSIPASSPSAAAAVVAPNQMHSGAGVVGQGYYDRGDAVWGSEYGCIRTHTPSGVVMQLCGLGVLLYSGIALTAGYFNSLTIRGRRGEDVLRYGGNIPPSGPCAGSPVGGRSREAEAWWTRATETGYAKKVPAGQNIGEKRVRLRTDVVRPLPELDEGKWYKQGALSSWPKEETVHASVFEDSRTYKINVLTAESVFNSGLVIDWNESLNAIKGINKGKKAPPSLEILLQVDWIEVADMRVLAWFADFLKKHGASEKQLKQWVETKTNILAREGDGLEKLSKIPADARGYSGYLRNPTSKKAQKAWDKEYGPLLAMYEEADKGVAGIR